MDVDIIKGLLPVLINPEAGRDAERESLKAVEALQTHGVAVDVRPVPPNRLEDELRSCVGQGAEMVAVCGGDGTISSAANVLADTATVLAPIPTGTLNHFARRYGITSIEVAAEVIAARKVLSVPVGDINGVVFINNASCGLYPYSLRWRNLLRRWLSKWPAAAAGIIYALIRLPEIDLSLEVMGEHVTRRTSLFWVGIGRGSFRYPRLAPANADVHFLEVVVARAHTRKGLIALGLQVVSGVLQSKRRWTRGGLEVLHTNRVILHARKRIDVARDGEVNRMQPPLTFKIRAHALQVAAPDGGAWVDRVPPI